MAVVINGNATFRGTVTSNTLLFTPDTEITTAMATDNDALYIDSDGTTSVDLKLLLKSVLSRLAALET